MASQAIPGFGTLLKIGDGAGPEVFTTIAEVKDITLPTLSRDTEDVTHHTSVGGWEEFVSTIKRSGEVTFDVNWIITDPTQDAATGLMADFNSGVSRNFKAVLPITPAEEVAFTAKVTGFAPTAPVGGVLGASITLKPTGPVTMP